MNTLANDINLTKQYRYQKTWKQSICFLPNFGNSFGSTNFQKVNDIITSDNKDKLLTDNKKTRLLFHRRIIKKLFKYFKGKDEAVDILNIPIKFDSTSTSSFGSTLGSTFESTFGSFDYSMNVAKTVFDKNVSVLIYDRFKPLKKRKSPCSNQSLESFPVNNHEKSLTSILKNSKNLFETSEQNRVKEQDNQSFNDFLRSNMYETRNYLDFVRFKILRDQQIQSYNENNDRFFI